MIHNPCTFTINIDGTLHAWHKNLGTDMAFGRVSITDILRGLESWRSGYAIQDAFPFLDAERREFIMTGTTPEMWNIMFPESIE
tara:strand:- start:567 stop:818 length:252 start_codon:yes stop_codon:yes gene_type:complete